MLFKVIESTTDLGWFSNNGSELLVLRLRLGTSSGGLVGLATGNSNSSGTSALNRLLLSCFAGGDGLSDNFLLALHGSLLRAHRRSSNGLSLLCLAVVVEVEDLGMMMVIIEEVTGVCVTFSLKPNKV